jgi:hypothetical protein
MAAASSMFEREHADDGSNLFLRDGLSERTPAKIGLVEEPGPAARRRDALAPPPLPFTHVAGDSFEMTGATSLAHVRAGVSESPVTSPCRHDGVEHLSCTVAGQAAGCRTYRARPGCRRQPTPRLAAATDPRRRR